MYKVIVDKKIWDTLTDMISALKNVDVEEMTTETFEEMKRNDLRFRMVEDHIEVHSEENPNGSCTSWHELYLPEVTKMDGNETDLREAIDLLMLEDLVQ